MKYINKITNCKSALLMTLLTASTQAMANGHGVSALEGQLIENVNFDCRGTTNYLIKPNSNSPSFVGHVQATIDLPESVGGGSWTLSGVAMIGADRGGNAKPKMRKAPIERCLGVANVQFSACDNFSGVSTCQVQLQSTSIRMHIDRGSKGLMTTDMGTLELHGMGTELMTADASTTE